MVGIQRIELCTSLDTDALLCSLIMLINTLVDLSLIAMRRYRVDGKSESGFNQSICLQLNFHANYMVCLRYE